MVTVVLIKKQVVISLSGVVGYGGLQAAAFVLVLFILLVIILRAGTVY
jgi:hypothetical protein